MSPLTFRDAEEADLPSIMAIEAAAFGNPWGADAYAAELQRDFARVEVATAGRQTVGYSCVWHVRASGEMEAHLLRVAVDPGFRRRGTGRRLVRGVLERAAASRASRVLLEVAASNDPARRLYAGLGFVEIGRRAKYYQHPPDDALVLELRIPA